MDPTKEKLAIRKFTRGWRLYAILIVCTTLPFLLFLYAADRSVRVSAAATLLRRTGPATDLAASVMEERLGDARASLETLAADPAILSAWTSGNPGRLAELLRVAHAGKQEAVSLAVYDADGSLLIAHPAGADKLSAASADWFKAAVQGRAYVSGVSHLAGAKNPVVIIAVPLRQGQRSGVMAVAYQVDTIMNWTKGITPGAMKWITVVDQNGNVVAGTALDNSGDLHNPAIHPEIKGVLSGQSGNDFLVVNGKRVLVTRHPVPSLGWGVLVEIPQRDINEDFWSFERPIALIASLFLGLTLVVGIVIASLYRRARESEKHVRQIITAAAEAFIAINLDGAIIDWNPKSEQLFGWTREEALGRQLHETIIPFQYREAHQRGMKHFLATGDAPILNRRMELSALNRNGIEFPVELSITRAEHGGEVCFNAFIQDITARKQTQEKIATLNEELALRVIELEERNQALDAFSYSVSHDVRAPLRSIAGFAEILREECAPQLTPEARKYLSRIETNVVRMQQLVADLLRFAHLGKMELTLRATDLNDVVHEVIAEFDTELAGRDVKFDLSPLPTIECDRGLVKRVFWNLIANAIKFSTPRSHAIVSVGVSIQDGQEVLFVRDNGVGFAMESAGRLFGAFQRLHRHDEFEGTGVGLATAQRIVLKHGGHIWAQSEPDRGATFFFSFWPAEPGKEKKAVALVR